MATSDVTGNRALDFLGRRGNIVGASAAIGTLLATYGIAHLPLVSLGIGVLGYGAGFLLGGGSHNVDLRFAQDEKVEVATIQRNIKALQAEIAPHRKQLPQAILDQTDEVLATLTEILPQWGKLSSFSDQKYTVNAILTSYLPKVISNYLNLPASYYRNAAKKQFGGEVEEQLTILTKVVDGIRDSVYEGIEADIKSQTLFLKDKFMTNESSLLTIDKKA